MTAIRSVIVYVGHLEHPLRGPYADNVTKQIDMFYILNRYRKASGRAPWKITSVAGEKLIEALEKSKQEETLLVIPAGQSSNLDKVFSVAQTSFIKHEFLAKGGGRLYATCGASYAMSQLREYDGLSTQNPKARQITIKQSVFPLFEGLAKGPLCPFPGAEYKVGFYSDAVTVTNGKENCTIYLSGGGSFFPYPTTQKVKVLVKYLHSELHRLGKPMAECEDWENGTILANIGKGAILLSMFHPYYGPGDFDVEAYETAFPNCGTNWRAVRDNLSPLDVRMRFVLNSMLFPLEDFNAKIPEFEDGGESKKDI